MDGDDTILKTRTAIAISSSRADIASVPGVAFKYV